VPVLIREKKRFGELVDEGRRVFGDRSLQHAWQEFSKDIIAQFELVIDLESILNPEIRTAAFSGKNLFGVTAEYISHLKKMANRSSGSRNRPAS
jgi:hypothetical protein